MPYLQDIVAQILYFANAKFIFSLLKVSLMPIKTELIENTKLWSKWKFRMPVIMNSTLC